MRVFFGLTLVPSIKEQMREILTELQQAIPLKNIRWSAIDNLHVTLKFIPQIAEQELALLVEKVKTDLKSIQHFHLELARLELFPNQMHPSVLVLQARPNHILANVADRITRNMNSLNLLSAKEEFRGHLTLARLHKVSLQAALLDQIPLPIIPKIEISECSLFESKPDKDGSNYALLNTFKFASSK